MNAIVPFSLEESDTVGIVNTRKNRETRCFYCSTGVLQNTEQAFASRTPVRRRVYLATYNFENVALAYMSRAWSHKSHRELSERIYGRTSCFYDNARADGALLSCLLQPLANKREMILSIMNTYESETGTALHPGNVLFFDDSEENVLVAQDVCRANKVDYRAFNRYFLRDWLLKTSPVFARSQCAQIAEQTCGTACCRALAKCFADFCFRNDIYVVVFDLDKTLLKIHSYYLGLTDETIREQNRNLDADFADIELVRAFCDAFENE